MGSTLTGIDTHPAIAAVASEESAWSTIHLVDRPKPYTVEVVRVAGANYFSRRLEGFSDVDGIEQRLSMVTPEYLTPSHALELRTRHDAQWAARPGVQHLLHELLEVEFFHEKDDILQGIYLTDPETPAIPDVALTVGSLGELAMQLDFQHRDDPNPKLIDAMELTLPRGDAKCEMVMQTKERGREQFVHYNGSMIVNRFVNALVQIHTDITAA